MGANTCFVLGAGFSVPAGLPVQSALLKGVGDNDKAYKAVQNVFGISDLKDKRILENFALEDVFTFLDKIITTNGCVKPDIKNVSDKDIFDSKMAFDAKHDLIDFIIEKINGLLKQIKCKHRYESFFNSIVERKIEQEETNTIITINWDTIQDFYINKAYQDRGIAKGGVDYCCYDWDYDENEENYV